MTGRCQVAVLGAGFGGLALAHRLAQDGVDDVCIFERADGVGGTWRANTYPGAACDVPSHLYSLSFAPNPYWSRAFASQPEILRYIEDCYDRFDVRRKVQLGSEIVEARWSEGDACWRLRDRRGAEHDPGLDGERVAVVGTGASSIQIVPAIAEAAAQVDVYQRSAPWILPRKDPPYTDDQQREFASRPDVAARHRRELYDQFEQTTAFVAGDPAVEVISSIARGYLEHKVADPGLRAKLTPDQPFGCKRTLISSSWYPAVQRDDVELITDAIERVTPRGLRTVDGVERAADTIVWCTGFRAGEYLRGIAVVGRDGAVLHDRWGDRPRAYHGMSVPGFPNFFMLYGPNTNQGGNSILLILEAQAQYVASAVAAMAASGASSVDVTPEALARYERELEHDLGGTVWVDDRCASYFRNAAGDIVTQLPHTSAWYCETTAAIAPDDYIFGAATRTAS